MMGGQLPLFPSPATMALRRFLAGIRPERVTLRRDLLAGRRRVHLVARVWEDDSALTKCGRRYTRANDRIFYGSKSPRPRCANCCRDERRSP